MTTREKLLLLLVVCVWALAAQPASARRNCRVCELEIRVGVIERALGIPAPYPPDRDGAEQN